MTPTSLSPMPGWLSSAWLARYLERQLTPEEVTWFEAYVLDKPELLSMIEADTRLRDAIAADARNVRGGSVGPGHADVAQEWPSEAHVSVPKAWRARTPAWFGLAAVLVIGLCSGWFGRRALAPATDTLMPNPTRLVFDTLRGTQSPAQVERAGSSSPFVLVEVAVPPGALHVMLDLDRRPPVGLSQSADGFVSFLVARAALGTGKAQIRYELDGQQRVREIPLSQPEGSSQ